MAKKATDIVKTTKKVVKKVAAKAEEEVRKPRGRKKAQTLEEAPLDELQVRRDRYLSELRYLTMILSAYGILTDDGSIEVETPKMGTTYWWLFKNINTRVYEVKSCNWLGGMSDLFRFSEGNMFLDEGTARVVAHTKSMYLRQLIEQNKK